MLVFAAIEIAIPWILLGADLTFSSFSASGGWIEEGSYLAVLREPRLDEGASPHGFAVEEPDSNGEDHVEAAVAEVEVLEPRNEEFGLSGIDVGGVPPRGRLNHLRRTIDRG